MESPLVSGLERPEDQEHERLAVLLRRCRGRLRPERASLGPYLRLPNRVGKAVTQEEVAEAAGISRQWYVQMESDRPVRVSASLLAAIADVLMMDSVERAALFRLAVPELRSASLIERSTAILEAFGSVRRLTRRLWTATTEAEALALVREHALTQLAPDRVVTPLRLEEGRWMYSATGEDTRPGERFTTLLTERWGAHALDDLLGYTLIAQPGDVLTSAERDAHFPELALRVNRALEAAELRDVSAAMAAVRSQHGFVARIMAVRYGPYAYSEMERAQLSTLADLTSLALSGSVP